MRLDLTHLTIRALTDPADPAIAGFGRLQGQTYPEPDMLIPPRALPGLITHQTPERRNLMLVAEAAGTVVGGTVFHYFTGPNTGFSSFMAVAPGARGLGLARRLHAARLAALDAAAGAQAPVHGLFIDVVAPERLTAAELAREKAVGADPVARRRVFHRLGFRRVDVAYYQPPDARGGAPITSMDLLYCPRVPADRVATALVAGTMHAYWAPWLGRAADLHAAELRRRCGGDHVALRPA